MCADYVRRLCAPTLSADHERLYERALYARTTTMCCALVHTSYIHRAYIVHTSCTHSAHIAHTERTRRARKAVAWRTRPQRPRGGYVPSDCADRADARRYHMDAAVLDMIAVMAHRIACKCYVRPTYPDVLSN